MQRSPSRSRCVATLVAIAALVALIAPSAAQAGHIQSRFSAPGVPDPEYQSHANARVDGTTVYYLVTDGSFAGDTYEGYKWTIGALGAIAFTPARNADDIDGGIVVYEAGGDETPAEIRVTDGVLDVNIATEAGTHFPADPAISGDTIVWVDFSDRGVGADILGVTIDPVTLAPGAPFTICAAAGKQTRPAIDGDIVAWQDRRNGTWDIYARDLAAAHTRPVCRAANEQSRPSVGRTWIAWVDYRSHGADVYARRWSGTTTRAVCRAPKAQKEVAVGDGFIVWTDWRNSAHEPDAPPNTSVKGYDTTTRETFAIDGTAGMQFAPDIDGQRVVYLSSTETHMGTPWWCGLDGAVLQH